MTTENIGIYGFEKTAIIMGKHDILAAELCKFDVEKHRYKRP